MTEHFFIAGAQRSGTTYLYNLLNSHPEIQMATPVRPEPKFFLYDELFEQGLSYYEQRYFPGDKPSAWLRGEKSASYIESEKAAKRIAEWFPESKILFMLRDPVERAISNYYFSVNNGLETLDMETAFAQESQRLDKYDRQRVSVSPYAYLTRGRYVDYLEMYERYFPRERMNIVLFEEFAGSNDSIKKLYSFLGVDAKYMPALVDQKVNANERPRLEITSERKAQLAALFVESNRRLSAKYGLNLSAWSR